MDATAGQPLPAVVNTACAFVALVASMVLTGGTTAHYYDITGQVLFSGSHPDVSVSRVRRPAHAVYTASIVNASLHQGRLPESQKHAIIVPMLKKPGLDTADMANFLPVSNLTFTSRCQSAYRKRHSAETAMLRVLSDALITADDRQVTLMRCSTSPQHSTVSITSCSIYADCSTTSASQTTCCA